MSHQDAGQGSRTGTSETKRAPVSYRVVGVNYRLIGTALGLLLLAGIGSYFSRRFFIDRNASQLLTQARKLAEERQIPEAISKISQFQTLKKGDRDAALLSASLLKQSELGNRTPWRAVSDLLSNALIAQPNDQELLRESLLLASRMDDWGAVINQYAPLLEEDMVTNPTVLKAALPGYSELNEPDALVQACLKAIDAKIPSVVPYQELVGQLATKKMPPSAVAELKRRYPGAARPAENQEGRPATALPADLSQLCQAILDEMLTNLPPEQQGEARALRARFQLSEGNVAAGKQELEKGLANSPDSGPLREISLVLARTELDQARRAQRSRTDVSTIEAKAIAAAQKWSECPGLAQAEGLFALGTQQLLAGKYLEAWTALKGADQFVSEKPVPEDDGFESAERMAALRLNLRRYALLVMPELKRRLPDQRDQLLAWQEEIRKWMTERKLPATWLELFDATEDFAEEKWASAAEKLEKLRPGFVFEQGQRERREVDLRLAVCQQRLGNPDAQIAALKRGLDIDPTWLDGQLALVEALASVGRSDEALDLGMTAQKSLPEGDIRSLGLELRRLMRQPNNEQNLRALLARLDASAPTEGAPSDEFVELRINTLWALQEHDQARTYLAGLAEKQGPTPALTYLQALAELSGRPSAEGARELREFLARRGGEVGSDSGRLRTLKAELALREAVAEPGAALKAQAENLDRLPEGDRVPLLISLASLAFTQKAGNAAFDLMGRALEMAPNDVSVLWMATDMQQQSGGDRDSVAKLQARLEELEGSGGPHASFTRGLDQRLKIRRLLVKAQETKIKPSAEEINGLLEQARKEFQQALKGRPSWREAHTQLAVCEWELQNEDAGYEQASQAFELGERSPPILAGMVQYLDSRRRDSELLSLLSRAREKGGVTPEVLLRGGVGAMTRSGDVSGALNLLREVNQRTTGDGVYEAVLMISRNEDLPRAERLLRDGLEGDFRQDLAVTSLVRLLIRQKRADEVGPVLKLAEEKVQDVPPGNRALVLASCYETLGELAKADELYTSAAGDDPSRRVAFRAHQDFLIRHRMFPRAIAMQQQALKWAQEQGEQVDEAEKLRMGSLTADAARTYADFQAGLDLITGGKPLNQLSVAALRTLLRIYPRSSLKSDRERAIATLEELGSRVALTWNEQLLRAFLLNEAGKWSEAWVLYKELMQTDPDNSELLSTFVQTAASQKDPQPALLNDMERAVNTLLANEASSFRTAAARARWMTAAKREAEAIPVLERFLNRLNSVEVDSMFEELLRMRQAGYSRELIAEKATERKDPFAVNVIAVAGQLLADPTTAPDLRKALGGYFEEEDVAQRVRDSMKLSIAEMYESIGALDLAEQILLEVRKGWTGPGLEIVLAGFYSRHDRSEQAIRVVEGLKNVPDAVVAQIGVGVLRAAKVNAEQARPFEERMLKMRSTSTDATGNTWQISTLALTDLYDHLARFDDAAKLHRELLAKNPNNVIALNNLAWLLAFSEQSTDREEAAKLVSEAVRLAGPVAELLDTRGVALMQIGQAEQAIATLQTAIKESPTPSNHFHLAVAQLRAKRRPDARQSFEKAIALGFDAEKIHPLEAPLLAELKAGLDLAARTPVRSPVVQRVTQGTRSLLSISGRRLPVGPRS